MSDLSNVMDQFRAAGMPDPLHFDLSGKIRRYGPKKRAWYSLREVTSNGGSSVIVGSFGYWGRIDSTRIEVDWKGISAEEREALRERQQLVEKMEREKREQRAQFAAMRAAQLWSNASKTGSSPYLDRKGVLPESVRFLDSMIIVPMVRYDYPRESALVGAQTIDDQGVKKFTPGTAKAGSACRLGEVKDGSPILICEGYATGRSIRMATEHRYPVFVAFDAYNLKPFSEILRKLYPKAYLLFCADDDYLTPGNPGRIQAYRAAARLGRSDVVWPVFRRTGKLTDYNDWHQEEGLEAVANHFERIFKMAREYGRIR